MRLFGTKETQVTSLKRTSEFPQCSVLNTTWNKKPKLLLRCRLNVDNATFKAITDTSEHSEANIWATVWGEIAFNFNILMQIKHLFHHYWHWSSTYLGSSEQLVLFLLHFLSYFCIMLGWTIFCLDIFLPDQFTSHSWETWTVASDGQV